MSFDNDLSRYQQAFNQGYIQQAYAAQQQSCSYGAVGGLNPPEEPKSNKLLLLLDEEEV